MTEEYKKRLIQYLTNNYNIEEKNDYPFFIDMNMVQVSENIYSFITNIKGYIQGIDGKGNELELGFIYGTLIDGNSEIDRILIVNNNFNVLQVIENYDTGTKFGKFQTLNIDKTNGQIYGIDISNDQYRFILLNNFLVKLPSVTEYKVKLRNSYFIEIPGDGGDYTNEVKFVEKSPTSSQYLILGTYYNNNANKYPYVIKYTINVEQENERIVYNYNGTDINDYQVDCYNIIWNEDNYNLTFICWYSVYDDSDNRVSVFNYFQLNNNDKYINKLHEYNFGKNLTFDLTNNQDSIISSYGIYVCYIENLSKYQQAFKIDKYISTTNKFINIYENLTDNNTLGATGKLIKDSFDNIYFYSFASTSDRPSYNFEIGLIDENSKILKNSLYNTVNIPTNGLLNVIKNNNLLTYNIVGENLYFLQGHQIYNENNYNYVNYQGINSLVPVSGILYDVDNIPIFARNLYNKTIIGNKTTSVLEIPYTSLNDIIIENKELLGETNGVLNLDNQNIVKNIYENLFINFNNIITIQNQNDSENIIVNQTGASDLNNQISNLQTELTFDKKMINKIKINYTDNTNKIMNIQKAIKLSDYEYQYKFNIYVDKLINSVELISNDELTSYLTINTQNLAINKYYKIVQNVHIESEA